MRVIDNHGAPVSLLGRLANAVTLTPQEQHVLDVKDFGARPSSFQKLRSRLARVIIPFKTIHKEVVHTRCPMPTGALISTLDGKKMRYWNDGSLRHDRPRIRGKAEVKRWKRSKV